MTNNVERDSRRWSKPVLRRIEAGSAESKKNSGVSDGGTGSTVKS